MGFLVLLGVIFGFVVVGLVVFIGYVLNDFVIYGLFWWIWVIVDGLIGVVFGLVKNWFKIENGVLGMVKLVWFNIY